MQISPYELGVDSAQLPQSPFYPQTDSQGPSFLDTQGCLCALQTSPADGVSEALWHCIGNQTLGVYDTLGGKWFKTWNGGDEVNGAIGDVSNGPNTEVTYIYVNETSTLEELTDDDELSVYDEACTAEKHDTFSFAFYGAQRQKNRGELLTNAAPCWRPGAMPVQIQNVTDWMDNGCLPGFSCVNNTVNSLPQYCPPIDECQMARLSGRMCSVKNVNMGMGPFEPVFCQGGAYCPGSAGGAGRYKCKAGTYCLPGSAQPTPCATGSYCPESSSNERIWIPVLVLAIVDIIIAGAMFLSKYSSRRNRIAATAAGSQPDAEKLSTPSFMFSSYNTSGSEGRDAEAVSSGQASRLMYPPSSASHSPSPSDATIQVPSFSRAPTPPVDAALVPMNDKYEQQEDHPELNAFLQSMSKATEASSLGLLFSYSDLSVRPKGASRPILDEVTGHVDCGRLTAVMGPSGAGKSTFINVLMGKIKHTGGSVSINGNPGKVGRYKKVIGYVPQDDIILPELTAAENIAHSARIRLPRSWTKAQVDAHVDAIIHCLELSHVRDSLVGSVEKPVLSGGQRKRVSIGMELAAAPMAMFLDEPTSGLDATSAASLMRTLKGLAQLGISIILTIHQPRSEIFDMIDSLIVFSSGRTIYQGPRAQCRAFFEELDYRFPQNSLNFGDALMDIVTGNGRAYKRHGDVSKESLITHWAQRQNSIAAADASRSRASSDLLTSRSSQALKARGASRLKQMWLCLKRAVLQQARSKMSLLAEMGLSAFAGFLLGLAQFSREGFFFAGYYREPYTILTTAVDFKSAPELALLVAICIGLSSAAPGVRVLSEESLLHRREAEAGHSRLAYFVAKILSTVPRMILICFHFTSILMILATPIIPWHLAFLVNFLYIYCIFGLANVVSAVARRQDAPFIATMLSLIVAILSGASPPLAQVMEWRVEWLWRSSPGVWLAEIYFGQLVKPFENIYQVELASQLTGYHLDWLWFNIVILFAIGTCYRVIAFALLCLMPRLRRWWR